MSFGTLLDVKPVAALIVSLVLASSAGAAVAAKPSVSVVPGLTNVLVKGQGFRAGEGVRLIVFHSGTKIVKRLTATAEGTFRVRVAVGAVDDCLFSVISAVGDRGSRASTPNMPSSCGPPIQP